MKRYLYDWIMVALLLLPCLSLAQTTLTGKVTDNTGQALPGVSIVEKGTTNGTATAGDGGYSIRLTTPQATLVFSFIGYVSEEVAAGNRTSIDVSLKPDLKTLSEVVVVGYGTQQKKDLTGSIASVKAEDIAKLPVSGVDQALQGQVAGLQISQSNGAPGSNTNILIRGIGSISGGNEPLFVIDGYPITNTGIGNPLNTINPNDIESIEVLKDASATAIYGSRGSNGVIMITTKRGKAGNTRIEVDAYTGFQEVAKKLDLLSTPEFAQFVIDGRNNGYLDNVRNGNEVKTGEFVHPVWVDLMTGQVYEIPENVWSKKGGTYTFKGIPVYDSPVLIADQSLLSIQFVQ